jgi:hypothetical protein
MIKENAKIVRNYRRAQTLKWYRYFKSQMKEGWNLTNGVCLELRLLHRNNDYKMQGARLLCIKTQKFRIVNKEKMHGVGMKYLISR